MATKQTVEGIIKVFFTRERTTRNGKYGFGFISRQDGPDVWFHARAAEALLRHVSENELQGKPVTFRLLSEGGKTRATSLRPVTEERYEVTLSEVRRGEVAAPAVVVMTMWGEAQLHRREVTVTRASEIDPNWPEKVREDVRPLVEAFAQAPNFQIIGWEQSSRLALGERTLNDDELRSLEVVSTRHDNPGSKGWRVSVTVRLPGYQPVEITHPSPILEKLVSLGVVLHRRCANCLRDLYTTDPEQKVHKAPSELGVICDDGENGRLFAHRWEMLRQAAAQRLGVSELPKGTTEEMNFFLMLPQPIIWIPYPEEGTGGKVFYGWGGPSEDFGPQHLLYGRCTVCGDLLVNRNGKAICTFCGAVRKHLDLSLLAVEGEQEPFDPFAPTEFASEEEIEAVRAEYHKLSQALEVAKTLPKGHPRRVDLYGGDAYKLKVPLNRAREALTDMPPDLDKAHESLDELRKNLEVQVGDLKQALAYYRQLEASRKLLAEAEQALAEQQCPLCGQPLEPEEDTGFTDWFCDGYPPEGGFCQHRTDPEELDDLVLVRAVNERGELLAVLEVTMYAPRSHMYRGPYQGDVIHTAWMQLKDKPGTWDGVTPFERWEIA